MVRELRAHVAGGGLVGVSDPGDSARARSVPPSQADKTWNASLALTFAARDGMTTMVRRGHLGPLVVQRPFFPEGPGVCHAYVLHPPGGLVPGDALTLDVDVLDGAHALVTAPAATKIYRSDGRTSRQTQTLRVTGRGVLEWLPGETIVFDGAQARLGTRIDLGADAAFLGWEISCFGRPACGEGFGAGSCRQRFALWRAGRPLVVESACYQGDILDAVWGLQGHPVVATLLATGPDLDEGATGMLLDGLRALPSKPDELLAATVVSGVLVVRFLGNGVESARILLQEAWRLLRPVVARRPACPPRIWST